MPSVPERDDHHRRLREPRRHRRGDEEVGERLRLYGDAEEQQRLQVRRVPMARRPALHRAVPGRDDARRGHAVLVRRLRRLPLQGELRAQRLPGPGRLGVVGQGALRRRVPQGPLPWRGHLRVARQGPRLPRAVGPRGDERQGHAQHELRLRLLRRVPCRPLGGPRDDHVHHERPVRGRVPGLHLQRLGVLHVVLRHHAHGRLRKQRLQQGGQENLSERIGLCRRAQRGRGARPGRALRPERHAHRGRVEPRAARRGIGRNDRSHTGGGLRSHGPGDAADLCVLAGRLGGDTGLLADRGGWPHGLPLHRRGQVPRRHRQWQETGLRHVCLRRRHGFQGRLVRRLSGGRVPPQGPGVAFGGGSAPSGSQRPELRCRRHAEDEDALRKEAGPASAQVE
mmetsp:Transcript_81328/g.228038  ORF Transcript_81328/g.228038 Transcript_81328/m.228038 type:complete len:396 (+) Transcript_81328:1026-2213(+)